ncbi:oxidoreductase-like domain-containing protein [Chromobacterium sp. IIBBL 290-4]|uniref:oxidoreductase-like domain-containing protein n=1 Tax=Chromobacterium sp. IIBBL 290-4 TaxID=2953890 RepID=UPI0020B84240|nr:oxidoreductase-like domain-containing protein [Chromobacterium sp. IIBBL 290-4]UTH72857.1 oxidoreductase-like domain-containing protein [Chromobacterium sp. IIBBL 290-4]
MNDPAERMPEPPFEVSDDMCCGSGCEPCILDIHQQELRAYRVRLAEWEARQAAGQAGGDDHGRH